MTERMILMIDDDPDDRELFCEAAGEISQKIKCYALNSGREAIEFFETNKATPDIIFLDINMPGMNGWECLAQLKKNHRAQDIPVIMYTTSKDQADIDKAMDLGALCLFIKPERFVVIKDVLSSIVENIDGNLPAVLQGFRNIRSSHAS